ncbi:MAG TPA: hypothetical protein VG166_11720 [Caulobacteraceae bacterium]|jgi:hypothetical protein|nr:hypothetical protein [Caulobacteraceae bacterium]
MESKELTLVAGGAAVALAVGLGAASWALLPVGRALKAAPQQVAFSAVPGASSATPAQMPPTEVPPLGLTQLPGEAQATPKPDRAQVAMVERPSASAAQDAAEDAADTGPRIVHAPPAERPSRYDRREPGPRPYETWRHYQAREEAFGPERGPPPADYGPNYPEDPDGG